MDKKKDNPTIEGFKKLYDKGYKCINYENNEEDGTFTMYLKDFEKEQIQTLNYSIGEGLILKEYIDKMS